MLLLEIMKKKIYEGNRHFLKCLDMKHMDVTYFHLLQDSRIFYFPTLFFQEG